MPSDALDLLSPVLTRTAPVLAFLCLVTVVAELADEAGLFAVSGHWAARLGGGSVARLLSLVCALAVLTTATLSLDTTVVLLTPVALTLVATLSLPPRPFLYACVWLANGASLALPLANLTNLLAQDRLGLGTVEWVRHLWLPQVAAVGVTCAVLVARHHRDLRGRYAVPRAVPEHDRVLVAAAAAAALVVGAATVVGLAAWQGAGAALVLLVAVFAVRRPARVRPDRLARLVPWTTALQTLALFTAVTLLEPTLRPAVSWLVGGTGGGLAGLLRTGAGSALVANVVNNLPAYLLLEPAATDPQHLLAVLVGVGVGPQVLLWGSVANLLWRDRVRAAGHPVGLLGFAREGLLMVPPALVAALVALALS